MNIAPWRRPALALALLACLLWGMGPGHTPAAHATPALASAPSASDPTTWQPGEIIVRLCDAGSLTLDATDDGLIRAADPALAPTLAAWGLAAAHPVLSDTSLYRLEGAAGLDVASAVAALRGAGVVLYAEPNYRLHSQLIPNDPQYAARQYALPHIAAPAAWDITTGSPAIILADLDTGVATDHPDLAGKLVAGIDIVNGDANPYDDNGHGTYTTGIMAAATNNGIGISGVCWGCRVMPVKILNSDGDGVMSDFVAGIRWAVDHGARVINVSAGVEQSSRAMSDSIRYAADHGVVVVASSGNTPDGHKQWPAAYDTVIAVGATDENDRIADFSSYGDFVDIAAPGVNILSSVWYEGRLTYAWGDGTSGSAPFVSGAAGLLLSVNPNLTPLQIKGALQDGADDSGAPGWDPYYGWGRLNIARALGRIGAVPPTHTPVPPTATRPPPAPPSATAPPLLPTTTAPPIPPTAIAPPPGLPTATGAAPTPSPQPTTPASTGSATLSISPATAAPGSTVVYSGAGFAPGELVGLRVLDAGSNNRYLDAPATDASGAFRLAVILPPDTALGPASAIAQGVNSGRQANAPLLIGSGGTPPLPSATPNPQIPTPTASAPISLPPATLVPVAPVPVEAANAFAPVAPPPDSPDVRYFAPLGHTLRPPFLGYWESNGGLPIFGYPLSEPFSEVDLVTGQSLVVQYFERNRFEYHPEYAGTPNAILLGLLGRDVTGGRQFDPAPATPNSADKRYFPATGHSLSGPFLEYWQAHGGLALFGYPISEPFEEVNPRDGQTYLVQYFERNRFEYHPAFVGTPNAVLLGLLGVDVARARGFLP